MSDHIEQFTDFMRDNGCDPEEMIIDDGVLHAHIRDRQDKPGKKDLWYILYGDDVPAGKFGHWARIPDGINWQSETESTLTPEHREQNRQRRLQMQAVKDQAKAEVHAACIVKAKKMLAAAHEPDPKHPYIVAHGITPRGSKQLKNLLLIPLYKSKVLTGLQIISETGKKFMTGSEVAGAYLVIKGKGKTVYLVEGWADACKLHGLTGATVIICFDCGNLLEVGKAIRAAGGNDYDMIFIADNDRLKVGNPGVTKATAAALATGARLAIPVFPADDGTDVCDLASISGEQAVLECIQAATKVEAIPTPAPDAGATTAPPGSVWPEPEPLPEGLPPVKQLDPAMIPAPFRGWLADIAHRMQAPIDFAATAAIVALGSIIGRGCGIYPKKHDNWLVVPNLYGGGVGLPSVMKTPTIAEGMKHINRLENEGRRNHEKAMETFNADSEVVEIQKKAICETIKQVVKKTPSADVTSFKEQLAALQTDEPTRKRYMTQDGTVEKIGELLSENPRGILISRDELIGWFRSLDKAGHESDRGFYLEGWNGNGRYTYDRIGRGTIDIEALCTSIYGAVTPGPLADYIREATKGGNGADGLIQRFQLMVWPDTATEWVNIDRYPDTAAKNRAFEIFKTLSGTIPGAVADDDESIPALRFTPDGQQIFDTWRHDLETRLRSDNGLHPAIVSHLAKYRSLMPSLALIFHLIEVADGTTETGAVTDRAAIMAAAWCDYLESHAGRIYGAAVSVGLEPAKEIVKHIQRGEIKGGCTVKDIYRKHWSRLKTAEDVKAGLDVLIENDWLILEKTTTGGRPSEVIRLNPRVKLL